MKPTIPLLALVAREKENRVARTRPPLRSYDSPLGKVGEENDLPEVVMSAEDEREDRLMRRNGREAIDAQ